MSLLQFGNRNRTTEPTQANATSSRSHAVCQVHVERKAKTSGIRAEISTAKLSLIDLAGSERASETKVKWMKYVSLLVEPRHKTCGRCQHQSLFACVGKLYKCVRR